MPRSRFLPSISTVVTLSVFVTVLGLSVAAAEMPDTVEPPADGFDVRDALELVYGKLETKGDASLWTPTEAEWVGGGGASDLSPVDVSVLAAPAFGQDGAERRFLLVQLVPETEGGFNCHACAPGIGAATFTKTAEGWRLDARSPHVADLGSSGAAPELELVQVGPQRYGVVFHWVYVGQGETYAGETFLLESGAKVIRALDLDVFYDNAGACGPEDEGYRPCVELRSMLEFVPGKNEEYFDLKVTADGTGEDGVQEETVYSYAGGTYRERSESH